MIRSTHSRRSIRARYRTISAPTPVSSNISFIPSGSNDNAPPNCVYVGRAEIGAKRSEEGRDYLSLRLDDPSFNAPIREPVR